LNWLNRRQGMGYIGVRQVSIDRNKKGPSN